MKIINIKQFINEQVRIVFTNNDMLEGWFVEDKYHSNSWSILPLRENRSVSFSKSDIKSLTWLSNNQTIKCSEIDFKEY